jgi:hypothetical protein
VRLTRAASFLSVVALGLVVVACGSGSSADKNAEEPRVTVTGHVLGIDAEPCNSSFVSVGNSQVTFRDGDGNVIGTVTTGTEETHEEKSGILALCGHAAEYSVALPKADFYQAVLESEDFETDPVSYSTLQSDDFVLDVQFGLGSISDELP